MPNVGVGKEAGWAEPGEDDGDADFSSGCLWRGGGVTEFWGERVPRGVGVVLFSRCCQGDLIGGVPTARTGLDEGGGEEEGESF